jgi:FAD/FMN-containing dehydrogenase
LTVAGPDWGALRSGLAGDVATPDTSDYDAVRRPAIANFHDVRPAAVVRCRGTADVAETVGFATRYGLPLAPRSGGHCFAGRSSTSGIVLDVTPMNAVTASDGVATVGAGARLGPVYDALTEQGRTVPAGCGPTVGVAGLVLGGGLGILGRAYGLTSDQLRGAEVVLGDGRVVRTDAERDPDLFWALRGAGGGRFGVVTSLDIATVTVPAATAFHLTWPATHAAAVVDAWQGWAPDTPDELAPSLLIRATGPADATPSVNVFGAVAGSEADLTPALDDLVVRVGVEPDTAYVRSTTHRESKRLLAELFPGDDEVRHLHSKGEFIERSLPADAIERLLATLAGGRRTDEIRTLDFMPWGGAYNRVSSDATAFPHRTARFLLKHEVDAAPDRREAARRWLADSWSTTHPWGSGGAYVNFPDPDLDYWAPAYHGPNLDRLLRVKAAYDPNGVFGRPGRSSR